MSQTENLSRALEIGRQLGPLCQEAERFVRRTLEKEGVPATPERVAEGLIPVAISALTARAVFSMPNAQADAFITTLSMLLELIALEEKK